MSHTIVPAKTHIIILTSLLALTTLTVIVAQYDFGIFNAFFAVLIASIKAGLVLLFFMNLKHEDPIYFIIFCSSVICVVLLFIFSKLDFVTRVLEQNTL